VQFSDSDIWSRIRSGDERSFGQAFKTYAGDLVRYATTILKNSDDAEDIVQQLFVNLWNKKETIDVSASLKSYLYKAVYNSSLNRIRQETVKESYATHAGRSSDQYAPDAAQQVAVKEVSREIEKAISELPEQCRLIFRMSRFEQLKYQQIADQLELSVKTVENQMGKALKHMRERLKGYMMLIALYMIFV
jgi:RNA polymerase sigma-70 factor (ECF subfamily)